MPSGSSLKFGKLYDESSSIYNAADRIIEGSDWITWQLTGVETRSTSLPPVIKHSGRKLKGSL